MDSVITTECGTVSHLHSVWTPLSPQSVEQSVISTVCGLRYHHIVWNQSVICTACGLRYHHRVWNRQSSAQGVDPVITTEYGTVSHLPSVWTPLSPRSVEQSVICTACGLRYHHRVWNSQSSAQCVDSIITTECGTVSHLHSMWTPLSPQSVEQSVIGTACLLHYHHRV